MFLTLPADESQAPPPIPTPPERPRPPSRRPLDDRLAERRDAVLNTLLEPMVTPENQHVLTHTANSIYLAFKPRNDWQDWVTGIVATVMVRLDRCDRVERRLRDLASYRAIEFWEDDQAVEVETLALKLAKQPARTVAKLKTTPAGLAWLLRRWRFLAGVPVADWTDAQRALAVNLVGADPIANPEAPGFAAAMVAELEARREGAAEADALARGLVEADLSDDIPGLAKLRRYAHSLHRQMRWYIDTYHVEHPDRWDDPARKPGFIAHDLIEAQRKRTRRWPFNPMPAPPPEPTPAAPAEPEIAETKPPEAPEIAETKPPVAMDHTATLASALPEVVGGEEVVIHDYSTEPGYESRRRRRSPMAVEAARRARINRRRAARALAESL